ncbi:hypothetical protein HYS03_02160 [Candidatus Woesebacteria bacterium]|nr:hypothetical protein [Candidatus Woesebacteria bacterium]
MELIQQTKSLGNVADKNTGGSVSLKTGSSDATVTLNNSANVNTAN